MGTHHGKPMFTKVNKHTTSGAMILNCYHHAKLRPLYYGKQAYAVGGHDISITLDCEHCTMVTHHGKPMFTKVNKHTSSEAMIQHHAKLRPLYHGHGKQAYDVGGHDSSITLDCDHCAMVTHHGKPMFTRVNKHTMSEAMIASSR
ncbi:LIM domain-binding protein [Operophtera brumata]|uniref:LIM domain-binding protein n=1 Tax=Operophtera brumata TaxID=104452 RepID=A0A0L7L7M4_OPEBR|nr:LIM domain-binding protein [Operophtera brumata]